MIEATFQCIQGIGKVTEKKLYAAGYHTWKDILEKPQPPFISETKWKNLQKKVELLNKALINRNLPILLNNIPAAFHWRLLPVFNKKIAFLDIETTGLSAYNSYTTSIAVYDGEKVHTFVKGENLNDFPVFIAQFPVIVTFFGRGFDIPFLSHEFKMKFPQLHLDVCFLLRKLGIKGGLKKIEHHFGIDRGELEGVDGYIGVLLWNNYLASHDPGYLETLIAYNVEDVLNLEFLLYQAYNGLVKLDNLPAEPILYNKKHISNPFNAHPDLLNRIISKMYGQFR